MQIVWIAKTRKKTTLPLRRLTLVDQEGRSASHIYGKRDDFDFNMINIPFLDSNIQSSPTYGVSSHRLYDMHGLTPHMDVLF